MLGPISLLTACAVVWWPETALCQQANFPPVHVVDQQLQYKSERLDAMFQLAIDAKEPWLKDHYLTKYRECRESKLIWSNVRMIQDDTLSDEVRLRDLEWLREQLGDAAYFRGVIPCK